MSVHYQAVTWNRQKKLYDATAAGLGIAYLAVFIGFGAVVHPNATAETLIIRAFATAAFLLLHLILAIGPLSRLDKRFLPLLYNRRHLGVLMFALALVHSAFSIIQFHGFSDRPAIVNLIDSFPSFQLAGAAALLILAVMAATSHDLWLHWLTPQVWKRLHMGVYVAYILLVAHVAFGYLQAERSPIALVMTLAGALTLSGLHIAAARRERAIDQNETAVCELAKIPDKRAVIVCAGGERIAVFRDGDTVCAVSNVCRHQNGPLGEGKIIDGCITCPWHGYQYDPSTGRAPAPFDDKIPVFETRVENGMVYVNTRVVR